MYLSLVFKKIERFELKNTKGLWKIEAPNVEQGGPLTSKSSFRLKNIRSGLFLAFVSDLDRMYTGEIADDDDDGEVDEDNDHANRHGKADLQYHNYANKSNMDYNNISNNNNDILNASGFQDNLPGGGKKKRVCYVEMHMNGRDASLTAASLF